MPGNVRKTAHRDSCHQESQFAANHCIRKDTGPGLLNTCGFCSSAVSHGISMTHFLMDLKGKDLKDHLILKILPLGFFIGVIHI